jgi:hypothetical protein
MSAAARSTDLETSRMAAATVNVAENQQEVLSLFQKNGPMADEQLLVAARAAGVTQSESGLRTRRNELVKSGLIQSSGRRIRNSAGNPSTVWELVGQTKTRSAERGGEVRFKGEVVGYVDHGSATFRHVKQDFKHHLYLHGCATPAEAIKGGRGAWGFDLALMEALREKGVRFVEVPTEQGPRYRTTMDMILGPSGFDVVRGDRPRVYLELKHWVPINAR